MANKEEKTKKKCRMKTKHKAGSRQLGHNLDRIELSIELEHCKIYYKALMVTSGATGIKSKASPLRSSFREFASF
jgi:hypothetical protein